MVETAFFAEDFHLFLGGCSSHPELAQKAGLSHEALERLLVAAAGLGLEGALQVTRSNLLLEAILQCYLLSTVPPGLSHHQGVSSGVRHMIGVKPMLGAPRCTKQNGV